MSHPPFPVGATPPEIQIIQALHRTAERHREPEVRRALSDAVGLIVELIEDRVSRRGMDASFGEPQD